MTEENLTPADFSSLDREPPSAKPPSSASNRGVVLRLGILGAVLVLAVGYMVYAAFPGSALYFLTVSEFMGDAEYQDGRLLRVSGKLEPGSFQRQENSTLAHFRLVDQGPENSAGEPRLHASYVGVMPDLFFNPHSEIILEGSYSAEAVFQAQNILVKCPSKYQSLEDEPPADYNAVPYESGAGA